MKLKYYIFSTLIQEGIYTSNPLKRLGGKKMNATTKKTAELLEILPESEQNFAFEFVKKLVLAWDPDFTKVTPKERKVLEDAKKDFDTGETVPHNAINWD